MPGKIGIVPQVSASSLGKISTSVTICTTKLSTLSQKFLLIIVVSSLWFLNMSGLSRCTAPSPKRVPQVFHRKVYES